MRQVLDAFDAAILINDDAECDRLVRVTKELSRSGIEFERFPAIVAPAAASLILPRQLGATLSHYQVVRLAKDRCYESVLILEDDVILRPSFRSVWDMLSRQIWDLNYDLLYFYDWQGDQTRSTTCLVRIEGTLCTHAYAVSRRFYDSFLRIVCENQHLNPIDLILRSVEAEKWAIVPNLAGQDEGISTIYNAPRNRRWSAIDG